MKKLLFLFLIFSISILSLAQPAIQWQKSLGGTAEDRAQCIQQTSDGGYVIAGYTYSNDGDVTNLHGDFDFWIVKLDISGSVQWQKTLGGTYSDVANSIDETIDGGFIVAGYTYSNDGDVTGNHSNAIDYWIVKLDSLGLIQWQKNLGGTGDDIATSVIQTNDSGYIVAGKSYSIDGDVTSNHGSNGDCWIVKLDNSGIIQWQKSFGGTGNEEAYSIEQTEDRGFIIVGQSASIDGDVTENNGGSDFWILKVDSSGTIQWQKSFGGTYSDLAQSIQQTVDGGYIVCGIIWSADSDIILNNGASDFWVLKLDSFGSIQWQKSFGGTDREEANSIQQTLDGGYILAGITFSYDVDVTGNHGGVDYWVVKIDSMGSLQWQKSLGGSSDDNASFILQTLDGGYIISGNAFSNDSNVTGNHGGYDYWIVKLSSTVNVNDVDNPIQDLKISPNPFTNQTIISFKVSSSDKSKLEIRDLEGQLIKNINLKKLNIGINELHWDATDNSGTKVSDGIYFVNIISDNFCESKKIVVLKN